MFSLLDGFLRYNQIPVAKPDHFNTTFKMKWGTFSF